MTDWTKPAQPYDPWSIDAIETPRFTEDGKVRLLEGPPTVDYRVIERAPTTWGKSPTPPTPWT